MTIIFRILRLKRNEKGVSMIETAFVLPIFLIMVFAIIEFGNFFIKWMIVQRAASLVASYVETAQPNTTAADAATINADVLTLVSNSGLTFANLSICAVSSAVYSTFPPTTSCGTVHAGRADAGALPSATYSVSFRVSTPYVPITPVLELARFALPTEVVANSFITVAADTPIPPTADCGKNQFVVYDAITNRFSCGGVTPTPPTDSCTADQVVTYDYTANTYSCVNKPGTTCNWGSPSSPAALNIYGNCDAVGKPKCTGWIRNFPVPVCDGSSVTSYQLHDVPLY